MNTDILPRIANLSDLPDNDAWHVWTDNGVARRLDDKRYLAVIRLMYTHRLVVGDIASPEGYTDGWCYHDQLPAVIAGTMWDGKEGEPTGWHRHPTSGRRRPDGDPAREHVNR